ncbi:hypothetical protein E8E12_005459 [Didymella heteroderae]|uniref:Uncharacterized protein n=1 Tax=Didymella heteroderae TaxID=1769908 RepID=A0A9P5C062_9PLEO|nr:hypothetical protein E8E12_005459 [Didymella heteroderae]
MTTAAAYFSSELFNSALNEVLIAGRHCGTLPFDYPSGNVTPFGRVMEYNSQKSWEDYTYFDGYDIDFVPYLRRSNAMVSLLFLDTDLILYDHRTDDPWFSATTLVRDAIANISKVSKEASTHNQYFPDEPVGVLGCATQRFFCNPDMPDTECINSLHQNKSVLAIQRAWPDPRDQRQVYPILAATYQFGMGKGQPDAFYQLTGAPVLLARNTMLANEQTARLPSNQWQLEREHIFTTTLAAWQSSLVAYARGSCMPQSTKRVLSTSFHSFSAWTLFILILSGIIVMLISLYLEELFDLVLQRTPLRNPTRLRRGHSEWKARSTLQLQRIAHQNLGFGTWKRTDESIPVTNKGDILGTYDIANEKHVRLVNLSTERKGLNIFGNVLAAERPGEEIVDGAAAGREIASGKWRRSAVPQDPKQRARLSLRANAEAKSLNAACPSSGLTALYDASRFVKLAAAPRYRSN